MSNILLALIESKIYLRVIIPLIIYMCIAANYEYFYEMQGTVNTFHLEVR